MTLDAERVKHTVVYRVLHPQESEEESRFLEAAAGLAPIPGAGRFELLPAASSTNSYGSGISMEFADRAAFERYNARAELEPFVRERWLAAVDACLEIDYAVRVGGA